MKTTIDSAGRLVIPKEIRREANLKPGDELEVQCREGRIEIEPAPLSIRMTRKGPLLVAVPDQDVPRLSPETVRATRRSLWRGRADRIRR